MYSRCAAVVGVRDLPEPGDVGPEPDGDQPGPGRALDFPAWPLVRHAGYRALRQGPLRQRLLHHQPRHRLLRRQPHLPGRPLLPL